MGKTSGLVRHLFVKHQLVHEMLSWMSRARVHFSNMRMGKVERVCRWLCCRLRRAGWERARDRIAQGRVGKVWESGRTAQGSGQIPGLIVREQEQASGRIVQIGGQGRLGQ